MPYKALIVDGHADNRLVTSYALQSEGYEVTTAASAAEALKLLAPWGPDLLVLEADLPDASGLEFCRSLRRIPEFAYLSVIMLSSRASFAECVAGLESGADDYLAKPAGMAELLARAHGLLARSERTWPRARRAFVPAPPPALSLPA